MLCTFLRTAQISSDILRTEKDYTAFDRRTTKVHTLRVAKNGAGQEWAENLVRKIGQAMKNARGTKSAKWLSDETAALGYRVSPTVIAKLDSGHRGSVLSVAELLVLAAALDIPPGLLLFPGYPDRHLELLPGRDAESREAVRWLAGGLLPSKRREDGAIEIGASNLGIELVEAVEQRAELDRDLLLLRLRERAGPPVFSESDRRMLQTREEQLAILNTQIARLHAQLWGTATEDESDE